MKIDIEKLNRKTPYPEPSEEFFQKIQQNVLAQAKPLATPKKETKVFAINFKWVAAAAVVMIAGITAFWGLQNSSETLEVAQRDQILDSVYGGHSSSQTAIAKIPEAKSQKQTENQSQSVETKNDVRIASNQSQQKKTTTNSEPIDSPYSSGEKPRTTDNPSSVDKVLAAFTSDQLRDIDKNSEQDVYLDLYN